MANKNEILRLTELAYQARTDLCKLCGAYSGSIHMGGDMSMIDVLTALFHHTMHVGPELVGDPERDRFILSKGHGAACMYISMAQKGFFDYKEICDTYGKIGSKFGQHPCKTRLPMLDASTGSLGHGLPLGTGMAAAARQKGQKHRVFVVMGDGETCEGSVWEAAMAGHALGLGNLVAVVDRNRQLMTSFSEDSIKLAPYADKWRAFGWNVIEIDGHDMNAIVDALDSLPPVTSLRPTAIVAHTTKGKGVKYMENNVDWHGKAPNDAEYEVAMNELRAAMAELEA